MSDKASVFTGLGMPSTGLRLPAAAHVPGSGTEPDWPPLEAAKTLTPERTSQDGWAENNAYLFGFELVQAGYSWEAHEVWEPVWLACLPNSRERSLMRGLIQIANAQLKETMGRNRAAVRLLEEARSALDELRVTEGERLMGLVVSILRDALAERVREIRRRTEVCAVPSEK